MRRRLFLASSLATLPAVASPKRPSRERIRVPVQGEDLNRASFKVLVDGDPARIVRVQGPSDDLMILLVLDLTGNVAFADDARQTLAAQIQALPDNVWIGLLKAQDALEVLVDPTPVRGRIIEALHAYPVAGKAGLLDTIESAARLGDSLLNRTSPRIALCYITDGSIYNYREDFTNPVINSSDSRDLSRRFPDALVREKILKVGTSLGAFQTPFFFVHLDFRSDAINQAYQNGLAQLAVQTGGEGAFCRSAAEIPEYVEKIMATIRNHWSLTVEVAASKSTIQVSVENGDRSLTSRRRFALRDR
ncbi:MAG: hypothetical protein ABI823_11760 [Bryobacteraceae bacterium]